MITKLGELQSVIVLEFLWEGAGICLAHAECHVCFWLCDLNELIQLEQLALKCSMQVIFLKVRSFSSYVADDKDDVECW